MLKEWQKVTSRNARAKANPTWQYRECIKKEFLFLQKTPMLPSQRESTTLAFLDLQNIRARAFSR